MLIQQTKAIELQVLGCSAQHVGDRREQQDRVAIFTSQTADRCVLGLVADGVGGRSGGALASENVLMASARLFNEFNPRIDSVERFFLTLVMEIHTILGLSAYTSKLDPHSTLAMIVIQPGRADWCHVGDSRLYHFRNGIECFRTSDHTLANKMINTGTLSAEKAYLHPSASHLVETLGGEAAPRASLGGARNVAPGDRFLLCTDGLWNYFHQDELAIMTRHHDLRTNASQMIKMARERAKGGGDNCSLVLLGLEDKAIVATE
jgi:PPM family protein phosphatase